MSTSTVRPGERVDDWAVHSRELRLPRSLSRLCWDSTMKATSLSFGCGGAKFLMDVIDECGICDTSSANRTRCMSWNVVGSLTRALLHFMPSLRTEFPNQPLPQPLSPEPPKNEQDTLCVLGETCALPAYHRHVRSWATVWCPCHRATL